MKKLVIFFAAAIVPISAIAQEVVKVLSKAETKALFEAAGRQAVAAGSLTSGLIAIGAALAIGLAVLGGTSAQGKAAAAALEGIARNPAAADKLFTPLVLSLALIESLVFLAFLVAYLQLPSTTFGF